MINTFGRPPLAPVPLNWVINISVSSAGTGKEMVVKEIAPMINKRDFVFMAYLNRLYRVAETRVLRRFRAAKFHLVREHPANIAGRMFRCARRAFSVELSRSVQCDDLAR
jgi:hypothetical protein